MEFKVVPFRGQIKSGFFSTEGPQTASQQLQDAINQYVKQGWEFHSLGQIHILVQPGCLGGLLGQSASTVVYDQIILSR